MTTCATCGAAGSGNFCSSCGTPLGPGGRQPAAARDRTPWVVAGVALAGMIGLLLFTLVRRVPVQPEAVAALPGAPAAAGEAPPDLSSMTPKERFDRLYNRVMRAAQAGDQATVSRFTPMALSAYEMLDTPDADARYHAALLRAHTGQVQHARALGDSILASNPGHLLGYVALGAAARWLKDEKALQRVYREFLAGYDKEMKANRPEYSEHRFAIEEFRRAAEGASPRPSGS